MEIPDKISLAINISNCQNNCKGCHSPYLREDIGKELNIYSLEKLIKKNQGIDCVVFMGEGNDSRKLKELASYVRSVGLLVGVYSGTNEINSKYLGYFDYIKIGSYIEELGGLNSKTTNQRLYKISENKIEDLTSKFYKKA